jgi:hypothetical protein
VACVPVGCDALAGGDGGDIRGFFKPVTTIKDGGGGGDAGAGCGGGAGGGPKCTWEEKRISPWVAAATQGQ